MEEWLERARSDYDDAVYNYDDERYETAVFLFQQAVEKGLKYLVQRAGEGLPRTHDCYELAKLVDAPMELRRKADFLSSCYFRSRYPDADEMDEEEVREVRAAAEEVWEWIQKNV